MTLAGDTQITRGSMGKESGGCEGLLNVNTGPADHLPCLVSGNLGIIMAKDRVQAAALILVRVTGPGLRQWWCDEEERRHLTAGQGKAQHYWFRNPRRWCPKQRQEVIPKQWKMWWLFCSENSKSEYHWDTQMLTFSHYTNSKFDTSQSAHTSVDAKQEAITSLSRFHSLHGQHITLLCSPGMVLTTEKPLTILNLGITCGEKWPRQNAGAL